MKRKFYKQHFGNKTTCFRRGKICINIFLKYKPVYELIKSLSFWKKIIKLKNEKVFSSLKSTISQMLIKMKKQGRFSSWSLRCFWRLSVVFKTDVVLKEEHLIEVQLNSSQFRFNFRMDNKTYINLCPSKLKLKL